MRHKMHRTRRRRITRTKDWLVGVQAYAQSVTTSSFGASPLFSIIDSADVIAHENHLTVLRIVGEFTYFSTGVRNASSQFIGDYVPWLDRGILLQTIDANEDVQLVNLSTNTGSGTDLEKSWMWLRHGPAGGQVLFSKTDGGTAVNPMGVNGTGGNTGEVFPVAFTEHIDIRVKRKMGERDNLVFWAAIRNLSGNWAEPSEDAQLSYVWAAQLRVLVAQGGHGDAGGDR